MSNAPEEHTLPSSVTAFIESLYRDPRYVLIGKHVRNGIERIAFAEACTVVSAGGEVRGQLLLDGEYMTLGRPDGEIPFGEDSLVDYYLGRQPAAGRHLGEEDFAGLREEPWQHYVRRNFCFQLSDFAQARDDAQHNLAIWNLIEQSDVSDEDKWSYLKWWPWLERDRAIAQALWDLIHDEPEHAATELYRALRSIEQFGVSRAGQYAEEEGDGEPMCETMRQHLEALTEMLRQDADLLVSVEEQLDRAEARGDQEEVARLRAHLIRQATEG